MLCACGTRLSVLINTAKSINLSISLPYSLDLLHPNKNENKTLFCINEWLEQAYLKILKLGELRQKLI